MNQSKARTKYVRISPRKARLAAALIRGLPVPKAIEQLTFSPLKGSRLLIKTLFSAVSNAESQHETKREELKVLEVLVDEGPRLKRILPKNRGGRNMMLKRTSHFTVVVGNA